MEAPVHLPTKMALAVFDTLETSYLSAISLREYFSERSVGNFPEGLSIREQSVSILRGHTIWDVLEYRLYKTFLKIGENSNIAADLARNTSGLVAELAVCDHDDRLALDSALCEAILVDAFLAIGEPSQVLCLPALLSRSRELASQMFSVWTGILMRMDRMVAQPAPKDLQTGLFDFISPEEERLW